MKRSKFDHTVGHLLRFDTAKNFMGKKSDEAIIEEVRNGNIPLYEEIVRRYQRPLFSFVYHMIEESSLCEDLVQETFIRIYKSIDRIDTSRKFSTYAFEIAKNLAISYIRQTKRLVSLNKVDIEADEDLYESIAYEHERKRIHIAVSQLRESYKDIISLYYFEDLSYEEISIRLKLPINTVRTHLRRGKQFLKKILEKEL